MQNHNQVDDLFLSEIFLMDLEVDDLNLKGSIHPKECKVKLRTS
jgi:hypothetical protein